ncbi:hypothetical protein KP509_09G086800 [Ceratopteris richardii]|uniref:1-acylglycerol-3-phosphate O-acyltransferase n=1 Tax=Ceratopteris richardii TaxID=49495 RepID=A0A8T2U6J4_CERRI|nr:hypothetical protein KP509_09G086800 [Ceratopteris richardii]
MGFLSRSIVVPLGLLFLFSGIVINVVQVLTLIVLLPISRSLYRRVNVMLMESLWSELVWLMDWWAGVQVRVYIDAESWSYFGNEHALVISNHRSDLDWLFGWVLAQRVGCLGSTRAVMKKSTKYLPVMGWSMWFSEYIFLERSWAKDEKTLKSSFKSLKGFPQPFWLALFVEGTRFTAAKLQQAQEYAASSGLPIPRNVLIPRTKGFVAAVSNLREFVPAVYDVSVAVPKESPPPTMLRALSGQASVVHLHIRRVMTSDLPATEDGLSQWCKDAFVLKDDLLDKHREQNTFGEELYQPIPRPLKPLLVVVGWSAMLVFVSGKLMTPLFSTWTGIAWVTGGLGTIFFLMQIFIMSTQSERSSNLANTRRSTSSFKPVTANGKS